MEQCKEVQMFEQQGRGHLQSGRIDDALSAYSIALAIEKLVSGHENTRFLLSADLLSSLYHACGRTGEGAALLAWAFHPAGEEPYPIYNLAQHESSASEHLWSAIQAELNSRTAA